MPRPPQIIPKWLHPHEETYVNDFSEYEDYTDDTGAVKFLCVFAGPKGRGELLLKRSLKEFVEEYGLPDYKRFGQAMYIPYTALFTGNAQAMCLCLKADDATFANLILAVGYKNDNGKMKMKFNLYTRANVRNIDDLEVFANTLESTIPDEDGYRWVPIMAFYSLGKGKYGEDFCVRIVNDKNGDKDNDYKNYNIQLLSIEKGGMQIENYNVTFDPDSKDPETKVTLYAEDIVNDAGGKGSSRIGMKFFSDNYQTLFDFYSDIYRANGYVAPEIIEVDRLPSTEEISDSKRFYLRKDDGSYHTGVYKYDSAQGIFEASTSTVKEVTELPDADASYNDFIYLLTADYEFTGGVNDGKVGGSTPPSKALAGEFWRVVNESGSNKWKRNLAFVAVDFLPSADLAVDGTIYKLTTERDDKAVDTMWVYTAETQSFSLYTEPEIQEADDNPYTIGSWDMFGYNRFTKDYDEFIEIDGENSLMDLEGVPLQEGSDGSFGDDVDKATREAALEAAYVNAFQGSTDVKVLSKRRAPVDLVLDAAHSLNIKKAMVSMVTQREDCALRLDTGLLNNVSDIYDMAAQLLSVNTYLASKDCGMFRTEDPLTGKVIPVSITLWMASQYPQHYLTWGNHVPLAGENYAVLYGYTKNSIKPEIDADDYEIKEKLYDEYRMNYIEALDEDTWVRGTQLTSQNIWSDLSEENNVLVLLEIKRKIERLTAQRRYKFSDEAELRLFQAACDQYFSSYRGTKCKSLSIRVEMSNWEKTRYIVHVYLEVVFRTFQKRAIIEIDVNPRVD